MDQTDIKTPNPCILTPEEQQKLLALLKKTNVKLGTVNLLTAPSALIFSSNFNVAGVNVDLASIINLLIGLKIAGAAPAGNVLRGNGINFISAILAEADLSFTDITTNNVSSTKHGLVPKSPADATQFLNGAATPVYAQVKDSDLSTSDITTNDVGTSKHGFTPKAPNDTTKFLRGDASWAAPSIPTSDFVKITENILAVDTASVTFSSIPSTYHHLMVMGYGRITAATTIDNILGQLNSDTGANYDFSELVGSNAASAGSGFAQTFMRFGEFPGTSASRSTQIGSFQTILPYYANTTFEKNGISNFQACFGTSGAGVEVGFKGFCWRSTAAINTIKIYPNSGNFKAGSYFSLFGLN
jgi:hypothetical protein